MDADLDTLATALYVRIDDLLKDHPELVPWRPKVGIAPKLSDAELLTVAVLQVLQGFTEETRWLRHATVWLRSLFPYLPGQSGYNKRLRKSTTQMQALIRVLAADIDVVHDDIWLIDSTPVECGRSRGPRNVPTWPAGPATGTAPATRAGSGGCACISSQPRPGCRSRSRSPTRKPTNATIALDLFESDPALLAGRHRQTLIADKGYVRRVRTPPRRPRYRARPTRAETRTATTRRARTPIAPPDHRVGQRHLEGQAQPGTPRRPHPTRRRHPRPATTPRAHRRDLAQPPHRPTRPTIPHRLRPLTPWNCHLGAGDAVRRREVVAEAADVGAAGALRPGLAGLGVDRERAEVDDVDRLAVLRRGERRARLVGAEVAAAAVLIEHRVERRRRWPRRPRPRRAR